MQRTIILLLGFFGLCRVGTTAEPTSPNLHFYMEGAAFTAEGIWLPIDPNDHAADETETELDCDKRAEECVEATADYFSGNPHISVNYFQIIRWDKNGIVASSSSAICVTRTIHIGFAAKHINDTKEIKVLPAEKEKACKFLGITGSETWIMALKNSKEWEDERNRVHKF